MSTIKPMVCHSERSEESRILDPSAAPQDDKVNSKTIQGFFDSIALRYDFLNRVLSFKMDDGWRRKSRDFILDKPYQKLLDLGIGTGKFTQEFLEGRTWKRCVGLDFAAQMLEEARRQLPAEVGTICGDFLALPFRPQSFDLVISAFTLRSVKNMPLFLKQIHDLLENGGKAAFLCLTRPDNFFFKLLYYPYLKIYLPLMGGIFSGNKKAYEFLSDSILSFQDPETTAQMMEQCGFRNLQIRRYTFGSATLITGEKP